MNAATEAITAAYMTIEEVAARLRIHPASVRRLRRQGVVLQRREGRRAWFDREAIERLSQTYNGRRGRPAKRRLLL